jgi:hypothetical protein
MRRIHLALLVVAASACKDDVPPPAQTGPNPTPVAAVERPQGPPAQTTPAGPAEGESETGDGVLAERPPADPEIERALKLIAASELRFVDPPSEPNERPSEYTAAQFASMLRTKWDWLGYDLTELGPWLEEIATRSFKTGLPYRVVLADGTQQDFRPWLDAQLRSTENQP